MAAKTSWHSDMERNYVAVTACSDGVRRMQGRTPRWALRVSTACRASTATPSRWTSSAFSASPSSSLRRPARPRCPRTTFPSATRSSALGRTRWRHHAVPGLPSHQLRDPRVAFLKSASTHATTLSPDYLPISYEIFGARSGGPRDPADRMRDTFAKVTTYLRTGGNLLYIQLAAALPFMYSYVWLMQLG